MSNLIVSLLGIVLVSALCVMGISYVGTIYYESQADAQASEIVSQATKVASAMRSWSNANGSNTFSDTNWSNGQPTDLISGSNMYLDALPQLGSYAQGDFTTGSTCSTAGGTLDCYFKAMPIANVAWTNEGVNFDSLFAVITSIPVCKAIARLAGGDTGVPVFRTGVVAGVMGDFSGATGTYSNGPSMTSYEFNCVVNDSNSNGTLDSGESMFFIYKVL